MENKNMRKLDMKSKSNIEASLKYLSEKIPNIFVETDNGLKIDFELLKQELSEEIIDNTEERFQLNWVGKKQSIINANKVTTKTLRPKKEKSINYFDASNIYIEGDNLDSLKILQESYLNKIDCIYIDPPYNTGNDFIYRDDFNHSSEIELKKSNQIDDNGNHLVTNAETNGRFHSDWLSMMYPRLKLARNLLTDDGVIFISIDENESDNLKKICDEIFGPSNYRNQILVRRRIKSLNLQFADKGLKSFNVGYEYVYAYSKSSKFLFNPLRMNKSNTSKKGTWNVFWSNADRPTMRYDILGFTPSSGQWRWQKELAEEAVKNYEVYEKNFAKQMSLEEYWIKNNKTQRFIRRIPNGTGKNGGVQYWVGPSDTSLRTSNWTDIEVSQIAKDYELPFDNPKNVDLIKTILSSVPNKNGIVLDFFSGSATTAEAIMKLNKEDNGNRKYILVQIPQKIENEKFENLCDIGEERIKLAIEKNNIQDGVRVFKVDSSNMKDVYYAPTDLKQSQLNMFESNIKENRTAEDLLTQVILDLGLTLDLSIEEKKILNNNVYFVENNSLVACFDDTIDINIVDEICKCNPLKIVFKESSFKTDSDKINIFERIKKISNDTEINIV